MTASAPRVDEAESVPDWVGEPLSWEKLNRIEAWLAQQPTDSESYWRVEGELELNRARLEFAKREEDAGKTPKAALEARLRAARAGFQHVLAEPSASPTQKKRAQEGLVRAEKMLGVAPKDRPMGVPVIARAAWGAMAAHTKQMVRNQGGWKRITVHHSAEQEPPDLDGSLTQSAAAVRSMQKSHIESKSPPWGDIGYHYLIDPNGRVFQGRELTWQGAHASGDNNVQNIGVCMIGNFEEEQPTRLALDALRALLDQLRATYKIPASKVYTHGELKNTVCPGRNLTPWVKRYRK